MRKRSVSCITLSSVKGRSTVGLWSILATGISCCTRQRHLLLKQYWGAGIEHVAKEHSGDDKKAAEGSNYRRAHHHLTIMYEAFLAEMIKEYYRAHPEAKRYCKLGSKKLKKWLVTSVDTDQWMIVLLAMGTGKITAGGDDAVDVTVARHVKSSTEYIHVNTPGHSRPDRVREARGLAF